MTKPAGPSQKSLDEKFMRLALREAERGAREGEVPVGAVIVRNGVVLGRAHNRPIHLHDPSAHAEVLVLRRVAARVRNYRLEGCDLYVTIEPCPMCAGAIVQARIRRVVYGARDPKAGACGTALRVLNHRKLNHHVMLRSGILATQCAMVIQEFFRKRRNHQKKTALGSSQRYSEAYREHSTPPHQLQFLHGEVPKWS